MCFLNSYKKEQQCLKNVFWKKKKSFICGVPKGGSKYAIILSFNFSQLLFRVDILKRSQVQDNIDQSE